MQPKELGKINCSIIIVTPGHLFTSCLDSNVLQHLFDSIQKEMENISLSGHSAVVSSDTSHDDSSNLADQDEYGNQSGIGKSAPEKGSKKKKGKSAANVKGGSAESGMELQESTKKKQRKGKVNPGAQVSDPKSGAKKDTERLDQPSFLSEKSLIQKIMSMIPDLEEQGDFILVYSNLNYLFCFRLSNILCRFG